ncbi:putative non-specific lipid-transfer protein AKCS9 [Cardamine amara subsp. amara]|uniref:Non-specific lipid-transfer protein AKCS9 n=1 Tax=Cardamine amara subsp. amara TaxID=228776 RepID=A0ABD1C9H2_CARAN
MKFTTLILFTFVIVVMLSPISIRATAVGGFGEVAASCAPANLLPCLQAITTGGTPSKACCNELIAQQPCLCSYIQNPAYSMYVSSPNARKVLEACKVDYPTC